MKYGDISFEFWDEMTAVYLQLWCLPFIHNGFESFIY